MKKLLFAMIGALSFSTGALAQTNAVKLAGEVKLEKVVVVNGAEKVTLVEPAVVVPGDRLLFSTRYENSGAQSAENVVVTNPLPSAVALANDSAAGLSVSVDGGKSFSQLASLTVADGKGGMRPAQAADVTHVRWVLATVAPGANGTLTYRAVVR
jgi:uncharacterized repeat protein (TIGR01451 family)